LIISFINIQRQLTFISKELSLCSNPKIEILILRGSVLKGFRVKVGSNAVFNQIFEVEFTELVLGDLARVVTLTTELGDGDHGVGSRTTGGLLVTLSVEDGKDLVLLGFIDQSHLALGDFSFLDEFFFNFEFHIDQSVTDTVDVKLLLFHFERRERFLYEK